MKLSLQLMSLHLTKSPDSVEKWCDSKPSARKCTPFTKNSSATRRFTSNVWCKGTERSLRETALFALTNCQLLRKISFTAKLAVGTSTTFASTNGRSSRSRTIRQAHVRSADLIGYDNLNPYSTWKTRDFAWVLALSSISSDSMNVIFPSSYATTGNPTTTTYWKRMFSRK